MTVRLPPDPGAHRVLADGRSAALVRRDGEVDWWCLPGFDGAPALWTLLDPDGACARWTGVGLVEADPVPAAPSLRTVLRTADGRVECRDGLVDGVLVRLVRALDGDLDLVHELALGGFDEPRTTWTGSRSDAAVVRTAGTVEQDGDLVRHRLTAARHEWAALQVVPTGATALDGTAGDLLARLEHGRRQADEGVHAAAVPRPHPERSRDALRVLEALAGPEGGVVAALTTSLPEAVPGDRQWDYRYCWLRDAALGTSAASLLGATTAAAAFLRFAVEALGDDPLTAPPVLTVGSGVVPAERDVDGVAGWGGVRPVRVGNGARGQVQHDALGLLVEAVAVALQTGGRVDDATWQVVRRIADGLSDLVLEDRVEPSSGVWELREPRRLVSEDVGRWLALDRAVQVARLHPLARTGRWRRARSVLADRVLSAVRDDGTLPLDHDDPDGPTDATALFVPLFGMARGELGRRLVLATLDRLGSGPFLHRYDPAIDDGENWDGLRGREGAFLPVSFMAVGALAVVGLREQAHERLDELCRRLPRLLPEMWDPTEDRGLGNVPLVWSHMELARALYLLDVADRRARWGPLGLGVWRAVRYVRLRRHRRAQVRP